MPGSSARQTDVLVVGAGPAGLVAAITLARYGADVLLVEKRDEISSLSRALVISTRTMEILRSWGVEDDVRAGAADVEPHARGSPPRWPRPRSGREVPLGYPTAAEAAEVSPTRPAWTPQDHLEPSCSRCCGTAATAEVRFETELVGLAQGDGVQATVVDRQSGRRDRVDASYIIGADGAHSTVRAQLGIAMDGPDAMDEYHRVEFRAPLAEVAGDRRYGLYVITHPDAACVLAPRGAGDRWGLSREWRAGQPRVVDQDDEELIRLVATAAGVRGLRPVLERRSAFSFAAQIADRYQDECGFLVGDAAHRMTPRGGTGMNTAIQHVRHPVEARLGGAAGPGPSCCRATRRNGVPSGCTTWSGPARPTAPVATPRTRCRGI